MIQNLKLKTIHHLMIYTIVLLAFISIVLFNRRSYQDSWILCDIFIPTFIFIFIFIIIVVLNDNNKIVALICSSFIIVLTLVPALKYELFYGIADVTYHYKLICEIMNYGHVSSGTVYSGVPGVHIFVSVFSLMLGISPNTGMKYAIPTLYGIFPLIVYFISSKLISNKTLRKYIIIASAFPIVTAYYLTGTIFPLPFLLLLVAIPIIREFQGEGNRIRYRIILIFLLLAMLISHTITPLLFLVFSISSLALLVLFDRIQGEIQGEKDLPDLLIIKLSKTLLFATILFVGWWVYQADFLFSVFVENIQSFSTVEPFVKEPVPLRFFEVPFTAQIKIFSLYHLKDLIISILSLSGLIIFVNGQKKTGETKILYLYLFSFLVPIWLILIFELLVGYGDLEYYRLINYGIIFSPFLVGIAFYQLKIALDSSSLNFKAKTLAMIFIMFIVVGFSLIQFFPYQPLAPKGNIISEDIPENEPLIHFNNVNTIYQKEMISFACSHFPTDVPITISTITSDTITRLQMIAFFNESFEFVKSRHTWYSPLTSDTELDWNLFLLHWGEKSGPFAEQVEYRTKNKLIENRNGRGRNIIYDNGESFIIQREWPIAYNGDE